MATARSNDAEELRTRLEFWATVVMAVAAVLTAWSAFQSSKWSGVQAIAFSDASAARVESTRASTRAGQQQNIDVTTFTQWLVALQDDLLDDPAARAALASDGYTPDPATVSGFLFERFRSEFRPAVAAWLDAEPLASEDAPATPFDLPEYHLAQLDRSDEQLQRAEQRAQDARDANQQSDDYTLTTVGFASVLFFAGISTKLVRDRHRIVSLGSSVVVLAGATAVIATFPIEI